MVGEQFPEEPRSARSDRRERSASLFHRSRYLIPIIVLSVVYFITAWLGLKLGAVSTFATLVWPPTGIALAALVIGGIRFWPGIMLGASLVNWFVGAPALVALGMGTGNTLEAV